MSPCPRRRRRCLLVISLLLIAALFFSCRKVLPDMTNPPEPAPSPAITVGHIIDPDSEVRGVWIASVWNLDYPSRADLSAAQLEAEADAILNDCTENGINTIFFQVRPASDALYDSDLFPVSSALSSTGELTFDPLRYFLNEGRQRNIRVYAWVNPLRATLTETDPDALPEKHPARTHPQWTVSYGGRLYLDPGIPEVRQFVADGVREIVTRYDVDGVVFDDYFYPYPATDENGSLLDFPDEDSWKKYGDGWDDRADWRRQNINEIVKLCHDTVHFIDPECVFGVSPYGVWQNRSGDNGGSETNSFEAYKSLYCDAPAWIDGGYIDFLSPQIYWDFDSAQAPFDVLLRWWNDRLDGTPVKLYVSHAAYKYDEVDWPDPTGELVEQITYARAERSYYGSILYGYDELRRYANGVSDDVKEAFAPEIIYSATQSNGLGVSVSSPASGTVLDSPTTYILGLSDPYYALTVNGERIGRTKSGYFSFRATLENGENTFTFEQNGRTYTYTLYYGSKTGEVGETSMEETPADPDPDPEEEEDLTVLDRLAVSWSYPTTDVATDEDILWVSCVAPVDSEVTVTLDGETTPLVPLADPKTRTAPDGWVYISYGKNISLPEAKDGEVRDCGTLLFSATHPDADEELTREGIRVRRMGDGGLIALEVTAEETPLKLTPQSSVYNDYPDQLAGMQAEAVAQRGGFYLLRMGGYVAEEDVRETGTRRKIKTVPVTDVNVEDVGRTTEIRFTARTKPAVSCSVEDGAFTVTLWGVTDGGTVTVGNNPLLTGCDVTSSASEGRVRYVFVLRDPLNFYGWDFCYRDGETVVSLRNPIRADLDSDTPLSGIRIVLDAGHGGSDPGAFGPQRTDSGFSNSEKDLNLTLTLAAAEKLRALGTEVILTREDDVTLDIGSRAALLDELEPDLCLSLHQNSMGYTADVTRIRGTLGLWCSSGGEMLADAVGRAVASSLGRNYRGTSWQALAMCRNAKFPSALIEVGFMTSVEEYEYMTSARGIELGAEGIADGVLAYVRRMNAFLP